MRTPELTLASGTVLVVHLVAPGFVPPGKAVAWPAWDALDGSTRHFAVSYRELHSNVPAPHIIVAHGPRALQVARRLPGVERRLVYRPFRARRVRRRAWRRDLPTAWVAAPDSLSGRTAAHALGVDRRRVRLVVDRASWQALTAAVVAEKYDVAALDAPPFVTPAPPSPPRVVRDEPRPPLYYDEPRAAVVSDDPRPAIPVTEHAADAAQSTRIVPASSAFRRRPEALPRAGPDRLASGAADPTSPGRRWWMYRPMDLPSDTLNSSRRNGTRHHRGQGSANGNGPRDPDAPSPPGDEPPSTGPADPPPEQPPSRRATSATSDRSGVWPCIGGGAILGTLVLCTQAGVKAPGGIMVPAAGLCFAVAAARHIVRKRPAEDWVARWLIIGVVVKLLASWYRHYTLIVTYQGQGDAALYNRYGKMFAEFWLNGGPDPALPDLRKSNFVRWFTGVVYYLFGSDLLTGAFVFGLIAFVGSYFWYRATVDSIPFVNRRLYFGLVFFAPSIVFWPSGIGKEALMQFGIGTMSLAVAYLLRQRLLTGLLIALPAGWLLWVVRAHLLALVTVAGGAAYLAGRVKRHDGKVALIGRPIGILVVAFMVAFTVTQGAKFLGIEDLSVESIEAELNEQSERSAQGGSQFESGDNSLNPINLPANAVTVLLRPFPWETEEPLQLLASLESVLVAALMVRRFGSLRAAFSRSRDAPFLMYCWVFVAVYAMAYASFSNFGLLVRQRSLLLPALFVLIAVEPALARRNERKELGREAPSLAHG